MTIADTDLDARLPITLTGRPPVRIREDQWPVIAHGGWKDYDGEFEFQANRVWTIDMRVRQHEDGRAIVYGRYGYITHWQNEKCEAHKVGALLAPGGDLPAAIACAAEQMIERVEDEYMHRHIRAAADECVADLPSEDLA